MDRGGCIYILTNKVHTVLYIGVTSDLFFRIKEHKEKFYPKSFSAKYNCDILVYYEQFSSIEEAIAKEANQELATSLEDKSDKHDKSRLERFI